MKLKKILIMSMITTMLLSTTGCGTKKTEAPENKVEQEIVTQEEVKKEENSIEETQKEETIEEVVEEVNRDEMIKEWDIVDTTFEDAPEDIQKLFKSVISNVDETLAPTKYIGSTELDGEKVYGFICKDGRTQERYALIYKEANDVLLKVSEPGQDLPTVPNQSEIEKVIYERISQEQVEQAKKPTTIEEAIVNEFGSIANYLTKYDTNEMDCSFSKNTITYTYKYPEALTPEFIEVYRQELGQAITNNLTNYVNIVRQIESDTNMTGALLEIIYLTNTNSVISQFTINNTGFVQ